VLTSFPSLCLQLVDLCMLDVGSLDFTYSVLATSALYHTESEAVALAVSGYTWPAIARCVRWMSAFALALRERSPLQPKCFHGVQPDDAHHLQVSTRTIYCLLFGSVVDPDPHYSLYAGSGTRSASICRCRKPECMESESFSAFFQGFEPFCEARI
jgi:hypothetical protein